MNPDPTHCIDEEQLLAFVDGQLEPAEAARVTGHLAGCAECRIVFSELGREGTAPGSSELAPPLRRGLSVGRYLLLDVVGAGAMGVVYTAYDPELDRRVALKLLHERASSSPAAQTRLAQEARALAKLQSPHVVAVYDVGTWERRVFVAMERVDGQNLRQWLAEPRSDAAILSVFAGAARGLAAAHLAGIVHRDFKPDNVLVDRAGRACVADFGLAKPATTEGAPAASSGESGTAGTPRYMAPEQRAGGAADARSDQFAFCLSLYEALHGALPGEPSVRAARVPPTVEAALRRGLDLSPAARHLDMGALVTALEPPTPPRSNARWLLVGAALLLAAATGLVVSRANARAQLCSHGPDELAPVWNPQSASQATAVLGSGASGRLDAYAQQWLAMHREVCEATRVRGEQSEELLDRRMLCLRARRAQLEATLRLMLEPKAPVLKAREAVGALSPVAECAEVQSLLERAAPPSDPAVRAQLEALVGRLAEAKAARALGQFERAVKATQALVEPAKALGDHALLAEVFLTLGEAVPLLGDQVTAEPNLWSALGEAKLAHDARLEAQVWLELANHVGYRARRKAEGVTLYGVAAAAVHALPEHEALEARRLNLEGQLWRTHGDGARALALFEQARPLQEKLTGPESPEVAILLRHIGEAQIILGRYPEAQASLERMISLAERDPALKATLDIALRPLGEALRLQGRLEESIDVQRRGVAIAESSGVAFRISAMISNLVTVEREAKRYDDATAHVKRVLELTKTFPEPNAYPAEPLTDLGLLALEREQPREAEAYFREALTYLDKAYAADDVATLDTRLGLAKALLRNGNRREGLPLLETLRAVLGKSTASPATLASHRFALAQLLWAAGLSRPEAVQLARAAREADAANAAPVDAWLKDKEAGPQRR